MSVEISEWLDLLRREYLEDFIRQGGAGVKVAAVADEEMARRVKTDLQAMADSAGYLVATVDAARTRVHMMQQVFFEVARQVPWLELARGVIRRCYQDLGLTVGEDLRLETAAAAHQLDARFLRKDLRQAIEGLLGRSHDLAKDFRYAMVWLCSDQANRAEGGPDSGPLLEWLQGDLRLMSALKRLYIFQRIGRHNARAMLSSLSAWCRLAGHPGLVLVWDLRQLAVAKRSDAGSGIFYPGAAAMDAYEVLRQLIDSTDDLTGMLCVVLLPPELLEDDKRGVKVYKALYERIWPDVSVRRRENPLSILIPLAQGVAVS